MPSKLDFCLFGGVFCVELERNEILATTNSANKAQKIDRRSNLLSSFLRPIEQPAHPGRGILGLCPFSTRYIDLQFASGAKLRTVMPSGDAQKQFVFLVSELKWDESGPEISSDVKVIGIFSSAKAANAVVATWHQREYDVLQSINPGKSHDITRDHAARVGSRNNCSPSIEIDFSHRSRGPALPRILGISRETTLII